LLLLVAPPDGITPGPACPGYLLNVSLVVPYANVDSWQWNPGTIGFDLVLAPTSRLAEAETGSYTQISRDASRLKTVATFGAKPFALKSGVDQLNKCC
jgi:hypothetical protein